MLGFDLRDAVRGLVRDRLYSFITILTLALTVGATTAVFSIVNGVLLKPLAYPDADRLVAVREVWRQVADRMPILPANEQHFEYWRRHAQSFDSLAEYIVLPSNFTGAGEAAQIGLAHASSSLFDVFRVSPALGRTLLPADEAAGASDVVVLADRLWRERFGADRSIIGRSIALDGKPYTVVGVTPPGLRLPDRAGLTADFDAFIPIRVTPDDRWVGEHNTAVVGRLRDGVSVEQARAELDTLQAQVSATATKEAHEPVTLSSHVAPLADAVVGAARRGLLLLLAAIGAVLLIACSNLANLSLTRMLSRIRDAAIRTALGAGRARLLSRVILEQLVLAAAGGAAGLAVAQGAIAVFVRTAPIDLPRAADVTIDARVLLFAAATAIVAGLIVAIVPAWHLAGADVHEQLRGGLNATDTRGRLRTRGMLVALQIAMSVTLLVVTGLLTLSFVRLVRSNPGFEPRQTIAVNTVLPQNRYEKPAQRAEVAERVLDRVRHVPGVTGAAWTHVLPLKGQATVNFIWPEGDRRPWSVQPPANYRYVSPDLFATLSIPVLRGRTFADGDRDQPTVPAVVTERTAAKVWPHGNPIGQRFRWNPDTSEKLVEVVGVVADTKTTIDGEPPLMVYMPYWYRPRASASLVVHTAIDPLSVTTAVRQAIHGVDPEIAIANVRPMEQLVESAVGGRRYQMWLFVAFGAMALVLATVGVYGVAAYGVSRRRREMNIRVALGATARQVLALIVRQGAFPLACGIVVGLAGALAAGSVVASQLYEVSARDPAVITGIAALVALVGIGATFAAAKQGLLLDPAAALRDE